MAKKVSKVAGKSVKKASATSVKKATKKPVVKTTTKSVAGSTAKAEPKATKKKTAAKTALKAAAKSTAKVEKKSSPASAKKTSSAKAVSSKSPTATLTASAILAQLEPLADAKMKAHQIKFGVKQPLFGVKMGDLRTLANSIKKNHALALELWQTKHFEGQLLASLIIEPAKLSRQELDAMVKSIESTPVADWFHSYVTKEHVDKDSLRVEWMKSNVPMAARAGWRLTAGRIAKSPEGIDINGLLDRIEAELGSAHPFIQWTMNEALATIGIHFEKFRKRAIAIGEKLGIYRDYPVSKGCTSPFAPIWIEAMVARKS